VDILEILSA